jgi:hypothetical protein
MGARAISEQIIVFAKVMGAIVRASVTAPWHESHIVIYNTGRVAMERGAMAVLPVHQATAGWPAAHQEALAARA